ncbi:hypothetical protein EB796_016123 [Bugula neritina]|uniref:Uncharacterized protein n=1 Tax=Bugula neritina TaxID=10212 RepID=A0A7J7JIW4_BUGNE|nr:hypothetical protein EB796_016123 [Bugula neritina]
MLMYVKDAIILEQFEDTCLVFDYYLYCIFTYASDDSNGEAVKEHIISSLQLASAALSPTFSPIQSSKHSKSTPVHSKCFKPLTIDCTDGNKLTDAADNLPGSNQPLNVTCTKISNSTDSSITCSKLPQETESVISMPNSLSSTPNSRTPSSTASSSNSRLSNQLRLAESKRQYEVSMIYCWPQAMLGCMSSAISC